MTSTDNDTLNKRFEVLPEKAEPKPEYKTPEFLGLSQRNYDALVKAYCLMEQGQLTWASSFTKAVPARRNDREMPLTGHFNMAVWRGRFQLSENHCGTICCLGGTAEALGADPYNWPHQHNDGAIQKLFYAENESGARIGSLFSITPEQAQKALYNYLTTGQPNWRKALKS